MNSLYNDKSKRRVIYCGRDMNLSKKQYQIFNCIDRDDGRPVSAEEIIEECYIGKKPQKSNVVTHICYINRQSRKISGHAVVASAYGKGYMITR